MRLFRSILSTICFAVVSLTAAAASTAPQNGIDYRTLSTPQPTDSGKKVEVLEFFGYFCPHCNAFDPPLSEWVKKQGNNIVFKRIHIAFGEGMVPQQRMYYALEAMGKAEELHKNIFSAIHVERKSLMKEDAIVDFVVKQGIDKQKFLDTYNSFGVQTMARRASQLQEAYKIDGVPTVAIDGRYLTSPSIVSAALPPNQSEPSLMAAASKVMDALVAKAAAEKAKK
jgi:protein dithiol oxidoreductase (disulfide-forming)